MQEELFHEDVNAALSHAISALGGNKAVGSDLWPSLSADQAGKKLSTCLNTEHAQHLKPDELIWILGAARKVGVHSAMAYITTECGYADPSPVEPEDEAAELQREFIRAQEALGITLKKMERLALPTVRSVG